MNFFEYADGMTIVTMEMEDHKLLRVDFNPSLCGSEYVLLFENTKVKFSEIDKKYHGFYNQIIEEYKNRKDIK